MTLRTTHFSVLAFGLTASTAFAQGKPTATLTEAKGVDLKTPPAKTAGWSDLHSINGGSNFIKQKNLRGQQDGDSSIYSLNLASALNFLAGQHAWGNTLTVNEAFSETPALPRLIKSTDNVELVSLYHYRFASESAFGSYGRIKANSAAFDSYAEKASAVDFVKVQTGATPALLGRGERQKLASGFAPQEYKESFGLFATPVARDFLQLDLRVGPAAKQFLAGGALTEQDNKDTAEVELTELSSAHSVGAEAAIEVKGVLLAKKLDYVASVETLYPLAYSPSGQDQPANDKLVSYESTLQLRYNLADWLALSYNLKSRRDPLIRPQAEVVQNTLLTATLKTSFL